MSEKIFNDPAELVDWLKENPHVLGPIPWAGNLISHHDNIGKGCSCRKKIRIENVEKVYETLVAKIFKENQNFSLILKSSMGVDKVKFYLRGEMLAEI
jgi:hypothetical protein|tara:strand:- start:616 stop:909 length:294 start_codon:yes stop_codon:yes gene_type:complete